MLRKVAQAIATLVVAGMTATGCATMHPVAVVAMHTEAAQAEYLPPLTAFHVKTLQRLEARLKELDITVTEVDGLTTVWGRTAPDMRIIQIHSGLAPDGKLEVLLHEAAHVLQPASLTEGYAEIFAELTLYYFMEAEGENMANRVGYYLAAYKQYLGSIPYLVPEVKSTVALLKGKADQWK